MTANSQFRDASEEASRYDPPLQLDEEIVQQAPLPRPAVLLGLAFGASAGLFTALYLLIF